jgi:DNA-directed RNA polymerase specialized sigma24 family protein
MDALLQPYLLAVDEAEAEAMLAQLLTDHASPIIRGVIKKGVGFGNADDEELRNQDADEIYSEAIVQLLERLTKCSADEETGAINNFRGYVAVVAFNAYHEYLRRKYPQRWRLKNRLRYLLTHRREFAIWESEGGEWICGHADDRERGRSAVPFDLEKLQQLLMAPRLSKDIRTSLENAQQVNLAELTGAIFSVIAAPVELDDLVNVVADLQGIKDKRVWAEREVEDLSDVAGSGGSAIAGRTPMPQIGVAAEVEQRSYLQHLWSEINQLPVRQRAALLLNLRDPQGGDCIALFTLMGIASIRQIAEAIAISPEELAGLWNNLPLDDTAIASRLGLTRQQVINLRKSARDRLTRRMKVFA